MAAAASSGQARTHEPRLDADAGGEVTRITRAVAWAVVALLVLTLVATLALEATA